MSPVPVLVSAVLLCGAPQTAPGTPPPPPVCVQTAPTVSEEAGPSDEPSSGENPSEEPTAEPRAPMDTAAVPGDERRTPPVVQHTAVTPEPVDTVLRVLGNVSTGLLLALGILALSLRLSVGWPRFPTPYLGRRRRSGQGS